MWKSSFYSRWLWESQTVYSALPPPRIRPCEMDVSGKHVPVLKDVTSEWRQISRSFLSGCMWRRTEWLQWSSEDLKRQRILCLPLRLKPWRPSPRAGQLELMPCAGANSQYKQQMLAADAGPQPSCQSRELVNSKTTWDKWSFTLLWVWKSGFVVSVSLLKRRSRCECPN